MGRSRAGSHMSAKVTLLPTAFVDASWSLMPLEIAGRTRERHMIESKRDPRVCECLVFSEHI